MSFSLPFSPLSVFYPSILSPSLSPLRHNLPHLPLSLPSLFLFMAISNVLLSIITPAWAFILLSLFSPPSLSLFQSHLLTLCPVYQLVKSVSLTASPSLSPSYRSEFLSPSITLSLTHSLLLSLFHSLLFNVMDVIVNHFAWCRSTWVISNSQIYNSIDKSLSLSHTQYCYFSFTFLSPSHFFVCLLLASGDHFFVKDDAC